MNKDDKKSIKPGSGCGPKTTSEGGQGTYGNKPPKNERPK